MFQIELNMSSSLGIAVRPSIVIQAVSRTKGDDPACLTMPRRLLTAARPMIVLRPKTEQIQPVMNWLSRQTRAGFASQRDHEYIGINKWFFGHSYAGSDIKFTSGIVASNFANLGPDIWELYGTWKLEQAVAILSSSGSELLKTKDWLRRLRSH